jgi:NAD(P)-dependent dehydrogenase (short-subunit alcohol dehydrogenase family)
VGGVTRRAIVVGSDHHRFPLELAAGLRDAGVAAQVVLDGAGPAGPAVSDQAGPAGADVAAVAAVTPLTDVEALAHTFAEIERRAGAVDTVVHAFFPPGMLDHRAFTAIGNDMWADVVGRSLHAALAVVQATHRTLGGTGGRLVVVLPALSLTGAVGLSHLATAAEGVRLLARSAARRWAADGITVNCVGVSLEALVGGPVEEFEVERHFLAGAALGRSGDVRSEIAPVVALLASEAAAFLTGVTLPADGGLTMAP